MGQQAKKVDIEMADMVGKTYFAIATWYNKDFDSEKDKELALKNLSADIIQVILEDTFLQMDGAIDTETKTVTNDVPVKPINQTTGGTGKMFEASEDALTKALRENK
jgi:hypothetical protein